MAVAVAVAVPRLVGAQELWRLAQPDSIPFELAAALTSAGGLPSDPQILVQSKAAGCRA